MRNDNPIFRRGQFVIKDNDPNVVYSIIHAGIIDDMIIAVPLPNRLGKTKVIYCSYLDNYKTFTLIKPWKPNHKSMAMCKMIMVILDPKMKIRMHIIGKAGDEVFFYDFSNFDNVHIGHLADYKFDSALEIVTL